MFGIYRYVLALMVANGHIQFQLFGRPNWLGLYAVFGFYTLSGYLMTRVLHETYGYSARGVGAYLANRALRIYPPYWAAVGLSIALLLVFPGAAGNQSWLVHLPATWFELARNLVLVGMTSDYRPALIPVAWSLHVEIVFYVLMGLGLSMSRRLVVGWFAASVAWTFWAVASGVDFGDRYSTVLGGSLAFSGGAVLYFFSRMRAAWMRIAPFLFLPHALVSPFVWADVQTGGFYASFLLTLLCVLTLSGLRGSRLWAKVDRWLGDLSYPIFLLHTHAGYVVSQLSPIPIHSPFQAFLVAMPVVHVAGLLLHFGTISPLESVRRRVRPKRRRS